MLAINEITNVLREKLPIPLDLAVSTNAPLFAQGLRPQEYDGMPIIKRAPMTSSAGPTGMIEAVGNVSGAAYTPGGALNAPGSAQNIQFQQGWGDYQGAISLTVKEMEQLASGENRVANWMSNQMESCASSISRALHPNSLTGNAGGLVDGLFTRAISALFAYGGINRAVFPAHASVVYDSPGAPRNITVAILEAAFNNYTMTAVPDYQPGNWVGLCDSTQMTNLEALAVGNIPTWNTDSPVKQLGARGVSVKGRRVYEIAGAPLGTIVFVNFDALQWEFLNDKEFLVQEPQTVGDRTVWNVYCHTQLRLRNPRKASFRIDDLN